MFAEWFSAKTIAPVAEKLGGKLAESAKGPVVKKIGELKLKLSIGFDNYIRHQIDRYSKIKTILGLRLIPQAPGLRWVVTRAGRLW
jgi:hypothetical protein